MTVRFEHFDPDTSIDRQRELFRLSFPENDGTVVETRSHYDWKFRSFPASPTSFEYAGWTENGTMAGYYAAIPFSYRVDGVTRTAGMVCDVMTHPDLRGQGVFTKIGRYAMTELASGGVDFVTGYPIRPEVIPGHLKVGWSIAFELPMYIHVLRTRSLLRTKGIDFLAPLVDLGASASVAVLEAVNRPDRDYSVRSMTIDELLASDGYPRFLERWMDEGRVSLHKSAEFLRWRLGAPEARYLAVVAERDGAIVSVAIARPTTLRGVPVLAVLDLMVLRDHRRATSGIVSSLRSVARNEDVEAIVAMMSRRHARSLSMLAHGFIPSPAVFSLITRPVAGSVEPATLVDESAFRLMWIDSDDL